MRRNDKDLFTDILEAIKRIETYVKGISYEQFLDDQKTQDSVVRNLEIMGEAVKKISDETKEINDKIDWKNISGLRNRLIHDYFGVNLDIVWGIIKEDLEIFRDQIKNILKSL